LFECFSFKIKSSKFLKSQNNPPTPPLSYLPLFSFSPTRTSSLSAQVHLPSFPFSFNQIEVGQQLRPTHFPSSAAHLSPATQLLFSPLSLSPTGGPHLSGASSTSGGPQSSTHHHDRASPPPPRCPSPLPFPHRGQNPMRRCALTAPARLHSPELPSQALISFNVGRPSESIHCLGRHLLSPKRPVKGGPLSPLQPALLTQALSLSRRAAAPRSRAGALPSPSISSVGASPSSTSSSVNSLCLRLYFGAFPTLFRAQEHCFGVRRQSSGEPAVACYRAPPPSSPPTAAHNYTLPSTVRSRSKGSDLN
jgi:hypothetical protein